MGNIDFVQGDIALAVFFTVWSVYAAVLLAAVVRFLYERITGESAVTVRLLFLSLGMTPCFRTPYIILAG